MVLRLVSPNIRAKFAGCRRHPSARVVDALANLPSRHIFHDPGLLLQVLLPLFDESVGYTDNVKNMMEGGNKQPKTKSESFYLSSSSAWSIGSIALRAAYFSSLSALHVWKHSGVIGV